MPASASRLPCVCVCVCARARAARESLPFSRERANKRKRMCACACASREQAESRPAFCVHKRGKSRPALSAQRRPASQRAPCPSYGTLCESGHSISPITRKDGGDLSRFDKTISASRMCEFRRTPPPPPALPRSLACFLPSRRHPARAGERDVPRLSPKGQTLVREFANKLQALL